MITLLPDIKEMKKLKNIAVSIFLSVPFLSVSASPLPLEDLRDACNGPATTANSLACIKLSRTLLKANRVFLALSYALKGAKSGNPDAMFIAAKIYVTRWKDLGLSYQEGLKYSQTLAKESCQKGSGEGCGLYAYNLPVEETTVKVKHWMLGCDRKSAVACFFLANYRDRIENLRKACEYSESDSTLGSNFCLDYAEALEKDPKSKKTNVQEAYDKACSLGYRFGCYKAALLREEQGELGNRELLKQQYGKVCIPVPGLWSQKYYNDACKRLRELNKQPEHSTAIQ